MTIKGKDLIEQIKDKEYSEDLIKELEKYEVQRPMWEFTEDEKVILRNLPDEFRWIARDEPRNMIYVHTSKPIAKVGKHWTGIGDIENLNIFKHLFQSIQWSDEEPCEFRRYL